MGFWGNFFGEEKLALPWNTATDPAWLTLKKSQETTAHILGITHAAYLRWEDGHATPATDHLKNVWKLISLAERISTGTKEE